MVLKKPLYIDHGAKLSDYLLLINKITVPYFFSDIFLGKNYGTPRVLDQHN